MKATVIKPPPLSLFLEDDYIMKNHLEIFESHMFLTTEHAVQTQSFIPKIPFAVGLAENKSINTDYDSQETRRQALQQFNTCLFYHCGVFFTQSSYNSSHTSLLSELSLSSFSFSI